MRRFLQRLFRSSLALVLVGLLAAFAAAPSSTAQVSLITASIERLAPVPLIEPAPGTACGLTEREQQLAAELGTAREVISRQLQEFQRRGWVEQARGAIRLLDRAALESLGAAPQTLSSAEMNEGLNRGTVDGAIQGWTGMQTFKSLPLVDQAYVVPAGAIPFLLLMNEGKWQSLSPAAQEAVMKHGGLAMAQTGGAAYTAIGDEIREEVRAEGRIEIVTPDESTVARYAEQAKTVHEAWIAETPNGQAVYDAAVRLLAEFRSQS